MGSKPEYEERKRARKNAKRVAELSNNPNELNVMINYCDEFMVQKMLFISTEKRSDIVELPQRRDDMFDQVDHQLLGSPAPTSIELRCQQTHILMNTLFGEVIAQKASKDFIVVSELAVYLIAKMRPVQEIDSARGYIVTISENFLEFICCQSDADCVTGLNTISEKFEREGGYQVTIPPQK